MGDFCWYMYTLALFSIMTTRPCSCANNYNLSAVFVFGDSLVDAGNNNYIPTLSRANYLPNGMDLLPARLPTGRYTNGRTTVDIIGEELGMTSFPPPYLSPSTRDEAILHGVNYASGGAGILNETGKIFGGRINLDAQIDNYANTRQELISLLSETGARNLLRNNSLFSAVIGSNDFIDNYLLSPVEKATISPDIFIDQVIAKYRTQLTRLYKLDARKLVVTNIGPIGCIPFERDTNPAADTECVEYPNEVVRSFNVRLKSLVIEMSSSLEGSRFVLADVYRVVSDILQNYLIHGFDVPHSACCGIAGRFGGLLPCGPPSKVCPDRSKYVFWDAYHPSDAANVIIAKRMLDGDSSVVFPVNIRQLVLA